VANFHLYDEGRARRQLQVHSFTVARFDFGMPGYLRWRGSTSINDFYWGKSKQYQALCGARRIIVAGQRERWRFADSVAEQRAAGWSLREQLLWRAAELDGGQEIDLVEHAEHFPELMDGFSIDGIDPVLRARGPKDELISKVSLDEGGSIRLTGLLRCGRDYVAFFMRRLQLQQGWAIHGRLVVDPRFRGQAIGARFVQRSLALYDDLGLEEVRMRAGLDTGRWLWAQMGFEFALTAEAEEASEWAEEVCGALGVEVAGLGDLEGAPQLARLECEHEVSFAALANAMPGRREEFEGVATGNGLDIGKAIPLGQLVMLSGEEWHGYLKLKGPQRHAFEGAVAERLARSRP
jgi:GNAT superfamily N-acetyltransferase